MTLDVNLHALHACKQNPHGHLQAYSVAGGDVDLAALDITAALAAEASGGAAACQRNAGLRVCWVSTGANTESLA